MGKISSYPAMTALQGSELILGDQSGATGTTTPTAIAAYMAGLTTTPVIASYARTAAEIAVGVTPTNYAYPPYNAFRYGFVGDGTTDDTVALQTLFTVCQQGYVAFIPFTGTGEYKISGPLYFDGSGGIYMEGAIKANLMPTGSGYTALNIATKAVSTITTMVVSVSGANLSGAGNGICIGSTDNATTVTNLQRSTVDYLRATTFDGYGIQINTVYDSYFGSCHADYCGNSTYYAFSINNAGDTSNQTTWSKIQVEAATTLGVFIDDILTCAILQLHAERAAGNGTAATHFLGGNATFYGPVYLEGATDALLTLQCTGTGFTNLEAAGINTTYGIGDSFGFGGSTNQILSGVFDNLTESVNNTSTWEFNNTTCSGTFSASTGAFRTILKNATLAAVEVSNNGTEVHFYNCSIAGGWTSAGGNPVIKFFGGSTAVWPPAGGSVYANELTVSAAFTTPGSQVARLYGCTFQGEVTVSNNDTDWRSQNCTYAAGAVYGIGAPGVLFGPGDIFQVALATGYLTESPGTAGAVATYNVGDQGWNKAPSATSAIGWICTTAGSPGTWTNMPAL